MRVQASAVSHVFEGTVNVKVSKQFYNPFTGSPAPKSEGVSAGFNIKIDACLSCGITLLVPPDPANPAEHPQDFTIGVTGVTE